MMQDVKWKLGEELEWQRLNFTKKKTDPIIKEEEVLKKSKWPKELYSAET